MLDLDRTSAARAPACAPPGRRADVVVLGVGVVLLVAAVVVGAVLRNDGIPGHAGAAPFLAKWNPHVGWGTPLAVVLAASVVVYGDALAARLPWRRLLALAYAAGVVWTGALAASRGTEGLTKPLTLDSEYVPAVPGVTSVGALLSGFVERIPSSAPDNWGAHVAGHPPGALLLFVGLDRVGLSGPRLAGLVCVLVGVSALVAVALAVRALAGEHWARAALPFLVLFPGAVWVGVSGDALFLAVTAWGLALLVLAGGRAGWRHDVLAAGSGLLLGYALYTSYGFVLLGLPVVALLVLRRRLRTLLVAAPGVLAVVAAFTAGGFAWWEAYPVLVERYCAGFGGTRPYAYWVWADLALLAVVVGPATWVGLRRLAAGVRAGGGRRAPVGVLVVVGAMAAVVVAATLSGMSKAEVERIWLPFAAWLVVACAALDVRDRRVALALQAGAALAVEHLLTTRW